MAQSTKICTYSVELFKSRCILTLADVTCNARIKGYKITGSSTPMYMEGCESLGSVCKPGRSGSVIEVARIEGKIFKTMKEAEAHGLELARDWVDKQTTVQGSRV